MAEDSSRRRLRRGDDRMIAGVAGGIADYVDIDPTIVRFAFVVLLILGAGITWLLVYVVLWLLMPEAAPGEGRTSASGGHVDPALIFGIMLVGLGLLFLANQFALMRFVGFGAARAAWPLLLIAAGGMLLLAARDREAR
ncbi:MAG: PspC domain-containing protein [Chloroflexi bacterium]|nr:PspC domain-containing protein [Chloroflexota bacterium]MDA1145085.1 PspC domain-containing protein [Chloroflexota bacterium]